MRATIAGAADLRAIAAVEDDVADAAFCHAEE